MTKRTAIIIALLIGALGVAAPIVTTLYLAREQSIASQVATIGTLATEVLRRADETGEQSMQAIAELNAAPPTDPCASAKLELMGALAIGSDELQGVGYVADNQLVCSSLGSYGSRLPIGPPDYISNRGTYVRTAVKFPLVPDKKFLVLTEGEDGYATIVDPRLTLDVAISGTNISVGILAFSKHQVMANSGYSDPGWIDTLGQASKKDFSDGRRLVSLRRSERFDTVAFAAIPVSSVDPILRREAETLVPIGVIAGFALAAAVLYMARLQLALPSVLKAALRRGEFSVVYQPVVDLRTRRWVGAEALVRWQRPGGEMVQPDVFIPVAEETGLIHRLTEQVVAMVGREAAGLFERYPDFHLGVNLAAADLAAPDTLKLLAGLLATTHARNGNLIIEATERGLIKTGIAQVLLRDLRSRGVLIAVDDFGTGYSSLSYLQTIPLDILKIDKSFVDTIGTEAVTSQVIFHIIEMAKSLKLRMIAEGVETEAQAQVLQDLGVECAQGWWFAEPMPFADLVAQLGPPARAAHGGP